MPPGGLGSESRLQAGLEHARQESSKRINPFTRSTNHRKHQSAKSDAVASFIFASNAKLCVTCEVRQLDPITAMNHELHGCISECSKHIVNSSDMPVLLLES